MALATPISTLTNLSQQLDGVSAPGLREHHVIFFITWSQEFKVDYLICSKSFIYELINVKVTNHVNGFINQKCKILGTVF